MAEIIGGPGNETLSGTADADTIMGNGGNDVIYGKGGADTLSGGDGDDEFIYGGGDVAPGETIDGGAGFDKIRINGGTVDLSTLVLTSIEGIESTPNGNTRVAAEQLDSMQWLYGGFQLTNGGTMSFSGTKIASSSVFRLANADTVFDMTGMLPLDPGNPTGAFVIGGTARDQITGGDRNDTLWGGAGDDILVGGGGTDYIYGGEGVDIVRGGDGNDFLQFRSDAEIRAGETYDGGAGIDTLEFIGSNFGGHIDLSAMTLTGIERITGGGDLTMLISQVADLTEVSHRIRLADGGILSLADATLQTIITTSNNATTVDASGAVGGSLQLQGGTAVDTVIGTAFADVIAGGGGNDILSGGGGDDRIEGGLGQDQLSGGAGDDVFVFRAADQIQAGEVIAGGDGNDRIEIASSQSGRFDFSQATVTGIEEIVQNGSYEVALAASQLNTISYIRGVFFVLGGGISLLDGLDADNSILIAGDVATTLDARGSTGFLRLQGGAAGDTLIANNNGSWLEGFGGDDRLTGGTGVDRLDGGEGNDELAGGIGNDELYGGGGINRLDGGEGNDTLYVEINGFSGAHTLAGGAGQDTLWITAPNVDISASTVTGIETLRSNGGGNITASAAQINGFSSLMAHATDIHLSTGGTINLNGKTVTETYFYFSDSATVFDARGVLGQARFNLHGGAGADTIISGSGHDGVYGGAGNDVLDGGDGDDVVIGGAGRDTVRGGQGNDVFFIEAASDLVASEVYDGGAGTDRLQFFFGDLNVNISNITLTDVEEIQMHFGGRLSLTAAQLDNATNIYGGSFVLTTAGSVSMAGVASTGAVFFLSDFGNSFDLTGYLPGLGNVTGGAGMDVITGAGGRDLLSGGGGNDVIFGAGGNDQLIGGVGEDHLHGGTGDDTYFVDSLNDIIFENTNEGNDTVVSTSSFYLYAGVENLFLNPTPGANIFGVGNELANTILGNEGENLLIAGAGKDVVRGGGARDAIFGEDGDDQLFGDEGIDYLVGGTGNDVIDGGADADEIYGEDGNDTLIGGTGFHTDILVGGIGNDILRGDSTLGDYDLLYGNEGDDRFYVDTPHDLVFEQAGQGVDTVYANIQGAGYYLYANIENLVLEGNTPFGVGNNLDNRITGNATGNYLLGGAGNDVLNGMGGNDVLFGEAGNDIFVFTPGSGADVIGDFTRGQDRIDLSGLGITGLGQISGGFVQDGNVGAILLASGDVIVLHNVQMGTLTAGDFIFASGPAKVADLSDKAMDALQTLEFGSDAGLFGADQGAEIWLSYLNREAVIFG